MTAAPPPGRAAPAAERLAVLQSALCGAVAALDDDACRARWRPALSPIGWHLRHCVFVEALWIRERALGDDRLTAPLAASCLPERAPRDDRAAALPPRAELLAWARRVMAENRALLARLEAPPAHPLAAGGYLRAFLAAHAAQHLETVRLARAAMNLCRGAPRRARRPLAPRRPAPRWRRIAAGPCDIGTAEGFAYDNEKPVFRARLAAFEIAETPVSNAEYLAFMNETGAPPPFGWRRGAAGAWYDAAAAAPRDLDPAAPVAGIDRAEAAAFARHAGARLPHEYEWERAARLGLMKRAGEAWEWCANRFHPWPGFRARPYREYSAPWFDSRHAVLRGGSIYTEPENRRPGFRNFYEPAARHIAAGLRLARSPHAPIP